MKVTLASLSMRFIVVPSSVIPQPAPGTAVLVTDDWDDWFEFNTLYTLVIRGIDGERHQIGGVKIGQFGMEESQRRPDIPMEFEQLDDRFFSLGQDDSYYEALIALGQVMRDAVLDALRDVAVDLTRFEAALGERVMTVSLLRSVSALTVRRQLYPLVHGNAQLTPFHFSYTAAAPEAIDGGTVAALRLTFDVEPDSNPPTNIHVLIGRNGVGKTRLLGQVTRTLLGAEPMDDPSSGVIEFGMDDPSSGVIEFGDDGDTDSRFANLVSVTFSAFDPFIPHDDREQQRTTIRYAYIGLRQESSASARSGNPDEGQPSRRRQRLLPKHEGQLANEFARSVKACHKLGKTARWRTALHTLESDPLFREAQVATLSDLTRSDREDDEVLQDRSQRSFNRLSAGHKIVLLTITRLVELVDERTLVLLDEPEAHLHPPLLTAFVRTLSNLLTQRNGVAIIATHSPVILQEVPRTCVWVLRRSGAVSHAERPEVETFGENVGVLTREVFGLEVTESGFHRLLRDAVGRGLGFDAIRARFDGQLGAEALALVRALVISRDAEAQRDRRILGDSDKPRDL